jgi:Kdo2-lipid IVA lauroyltransferase/acyltransferase
MARITQRIRRRVIASITIFIAKLLGSLPLSWSRGFARTTARVVYCIVPRLRKIGMANLKLAFGDELTEGERRQILKGAIENMVTVAVEFPRIPQLKGDFLRDQVSVRGDEHLPVDRGCLVIGGHLGNWEWMAPAMAEFGHKGAEVVRPLNDPLLDAYVDGTRRGDKVCTIPKERAGREIVERINQGYMVGILVDQSQTSNGVPARFFGQPCWATIGPVVLALRHQIPVHGVSMTRGPDGRYTIEFTPEIPMVRTGSMREDIVENVQRCQDAVEAAIRKCPGQWLWLHRRWKARPRLEQEWQKRMEDRKEKD